MNIRKAAEELICELLADYTPEDVCTAESHMSNLLAPCVEVVREVLNSGIAQDDVRLDYLEVQIPRSVWAALKALEGGDDG